jgi:Tfp pilus assembly protein PilF
LSISPYNSYLYFILANVQDTMGNDVAADRNFKKAIRLNPTQATYLQNYGSFLDRRGKHTIADALMQAGIRHDRIDPDRKRNYAQFLFNANENEKGMEVMSTVFDQDPGQAGVDIAFLTDAGISDADIRLSLPDRVEPYLAFASYLDQKGDREQAAIIYHQALSFINHEKVVQPDYFLRVSGFFREQKRYEEALDVILQAIEFFPSDADLRKAAGNLYEEMGLTHRAAEEYRLALTIEQGNPKTRKQSEILKQNTD